VNRASRSPSGVTLVELLVVLAILGIGAATVLPAVAASGSKGAGGSAAAEVARMIRSARGAALERGATLTLVLDPGSGRYLLAADSSGIDRDTGSLALPPGASLVDTRPRLRFVFAADGTVHGDSVTVREGDRVSVIRVERWSGALDVP
jgi:prepilin-type N-terminal cleavage/methylation domain-containing protein